MEPTAEIHNKKKLQKSLSQDLTKKLITTVTLIFILSTLGSYGLFSYQSQHLYHQKISEYITYLRDSLEVPLWNVDKDWIESICESFAKNEAVGLLKVAGEDGEELFKIANENENALIKRTSQVYHNGHMIGNIEIGLTKSVYQKSNYQLLFGSILTLLLVVVGLGFSTKMILDRIVKRPFSHLMERIDRISTGQYKEKPESFNHIEIIAIISKFNDMAYKVKRREDTLIETNQKLETEILDRKRAETALRESEKRYRQLVEDLPVGMFRSSAQAQGRFLMANPAFLKMFGYDSIDQVTRNQAKNLYHDPNMRKHILEMMNSEEALQGLEMEFKRCDGSPLVGLMTAHMVKDKRERPLYIDGIIEDITDRKKLELQIRQRQKMEAIGTLVGGIAHDFNNILSSIFGFAEAAKLKHASGDKIDNYIDEILNGGLRARSLIKQIMASSRQNDIRKIATTISPILKETVKFLRASLPAMIEIKHKIQISEAVVLADPTHIHQILMNLCTNAAHAMKSNGGLISIKLDQTTVADESDFQYNELKPGEYIRLSVSDEGEGIKPEYIERIFEPFFTTKKRGEGTGMGLAVIHGIVKDMDGTIEIQSELGKGSTFDVLLPKYEGEISRSVHHLPAPKKGMGQILFVDDEMGFLITGKEILEQIGYSITIASSGHEALALFKAAKGQFDLVITDLDMPKMNGIDLAKQLKRIKADIDIILCTGFSDKISDIKNEITDIVMKPLLAGEFTSAIENILKKRKKPIHHGQSSNH